LTLVATLFALFAALLAITAVSALAAFAAVVTPLAPGLAALRGRRLGGGRFLGRGAAAPTRLGHLGQLGALGEVLAQHPGDDALGVVVAEEAPSEGAIFAAPAARHV